jgi:hypothetical protein
VALQKPDGGDVGSGNYDIISQVSGNQVNPDNTTTPIETITFRARLYDVVATFNVLASTYQADGAPGLVSEKTAQVEQIAAADHVVALRGAPDIDPISKRLYNYLVVTVGTDDFARTSEVWIRMDQIGLPSAFGKIAAAWTLMQQLGPTGTLAV